MNAWGTNAVITIVMGILISCSASRSSKNVIEEKAKEDQLVIQGEDEKEQNKAFDKIEYHYQDASVPPPHHRSYSYILTRESFQFIVDAYGTVIKDTILPMPEGKWEKIQGMFGKAVSNKKHKTNSPGCTGGHGESITTWFEGNRIFHGYNYYCGQETEGDLGGDIDGFVEALVQGIPGNVFLY